MADTKPGTWKTLLSMRVGRDPNLGPNAPPGAHTHTHTHTHTHSPRPASPPVPSPSPYTAYYHSAPVVPTHTLHPLEPRQRPRAARGHPQARGRQQPTAVSPYLASSSHPAPALAPSPAKSTPRTPSPLAAHGLHRRSSAREPARTSAPRPALAPDDHRPRRPPQARRTQHSRPIDSLPPPARPLRPRLHAQRSSTPRSSPELDNADDPDTRGPQADTSAPLHGVGLGISIPQTPPGSPPGTSTGGSAYASASPQLGTLELSDHEPSSSAANEALARFEPLVPLPLDTTAAGDSGSEEESEAGRITFGPPLSSDPAPDHNSDPKTATGRVSLTDSYLPDPAGDKTSHRRRIHSRRRTADRLDGNYEDAEPKGGRKLLRARSLRVEKPTRDLPVNGEDRAARGSTDPLRGAGLGRKGSARTTGEVRRRRSLSYTSDEPALRRRGSRRAPAAPAPTTPLANLSADPPSSVVVSPPSSLIDPRNDRADAARGPTRRPIEVGPSHFSKIRLLGKGDVGRVYLVRDKHAGTLYAMKVLNKKEMLKRQKVKRVLSEQSILLASHHPFIVTLHHTFQSDEFLYLCLEFAEGGEFFTALQACDGNVLTEADARFYAAEVVTALAYLHAHGFIYRDLKPENLLLSQEGHLLLSDFDLSARVGAGSGWRTNSFVGTEEYIAPEVIRGDGHTMCVDWWTLGILIYEMVFACTPFKGRTRDRTFDHILSDEVTFPLAPPVPGGGLSSAGKSLVRRLLEKDEGLRLGSASRGGASDVRAHFWFVSTRWGELQHLTPPIKPGAVYVTRRDEHGDVGGEEDELVAYHASATRTKPVERPRVHERRRRADDPFGAFESVTLTHPDD